MASIKNKLQSSEHLISRLFLTACVIYTLVSVLFDYEAATHAGISETACPAIHIGADSEDELKQMLVDQFAPTFVFSVGEPVDLEEELVVPYQIVPDPTEAGRYVWRGGVAYPIDYGASSAGVSVNIGPERYSISLSKNVLRMAGWLFGQAHVDSHLGDVEMFELYLKPAQEDGYWEIDGLSVFPHGSRKTYAANEVRCFRDSPILYVGRGKHAMYTSIQECNHYSGLNRGSIYLNAERCSIGELYYPSTAPEFNVGDSQNPINVFATSPTLLAREVFIDEDAWGDCFYGGHGENEDDDSACRSHFTWW